MQENGVHSLININQTLFILAGTEGRIYSSQGLVANLIGQIPKSIVNTDGSIPLTYFPGAIANYKGKLFFGLGSSSVIDGMGVWSLLQTSKGNILNLEHGISTGNWGASVALQIGALLPIDSDKLLVGFFDTTYGIDLTDTTKVSTGYSGYLISAFYQVGSNLMKRAFTQLEFLLARLLRTSEGVKVEYRTNLTADFSDGLIGTYTFTSLGAVLSHNAIASIPSCEFVQIKISLTGSTTSPDWRILTLQ